MESEIKWFNQNIKNSHVHERNILAKIRNLSSLLSSQKAELQNVIREYKEWHDVSYDVDPDYSRIDQIFVLRKQKRRSNRSNSIYFEVVRDLFNFVKEHLERDWSNIKKN